MSFLSYCVICFVYFLVYLFVLCFFFFFFSSRRRHTRWTGDWSSDVCSSDLGEVGKRTTAIVIGCGPVGLGVILCLKAKGVQTVVAADFSPGRRALAGA